MPSTAPRSRLVTKEEMKKGLANLAPNEPMDVGFYSHLAQYAGFEVGPQELALLILQAVEEQSTGRMLDLARVIEVVLGEQGKPLVDATVMTLIDMVVHPKNT